MTREHLTPSSLLRRLGPSPESLAAAAALHDPGLLLRLQAERLHGMRPMGTPAPRRHPSGRRSSVHDVLAGETGGALLLVTVGPWTLDR
jgi:hypothetical protein